MKKILLAVFCISTFSALNAQRHTISGYISDAESGEKLISANVYDFESGAGTVSNSYGFYSLTLPEGKVSLDYSFVGYESYMSDFELTKDTLINVSLRPGNTLDEVLITASRKEKIQKKVQMSKVEVQVSDIEKIPSLLGEADVLKTLQLLPGVQGGLEGFNGLYVRGGSPDQNLVILDGVPVYNVSHLFGFISVFNTDAIKNVSLTKGGFPARYGGRLSSVIEINMKEGNRKEWHGAGSIGLLSSRLSLEGPIVKDKTSFMISGRRNYIDLIVKPLVKNPSANSFEDLDFTAYFYDLNAKINHSFNDKHTLYASAYLGSDVFGMDITDSYNNNDYYRTAGGIDWGNIITAVRWNYKISPKLFANTTLTYSKFRFDFEALDEQRYDDELYRYNARYFSGIFDWAGKLDVDYIPDPVHYFRFGLGETYHTYNPGAFHFSGEEVITENYNFTQKERYSHEYFIYAEDELNLKSLKLNLGVHLSGFAVDDTNYFYPQPRIAMRYLFNDKWSVKASYATMAQYINLLTNESVGMPSDLWVPSTARIKPQTSQQYAIGVATTLPDDIEWSWEAYYKKMQNVISYKEGAGFAGFNENWEDKITQGKGTTYGMEILFQKKYGKTTGWLGYTLSWNNRQFDDINNGNEFPYKFDRRHDIGITLAHKLSEHTTVSGTWVYATGNAMTLTEATYIDDYYISGLYGGNNQQHVEDYQYSYVNISGSKNAFRMPAYHRLDIGVEFSKKKKWGERAWIFSIYNAYNRRNPYFIYLGDDWENDRKVYKQVSLIPVLPSFSYKFKF